MSGHSGRGSIEVDRRRSEHDIVIDGGEVRRRSKKASKPSRRARPLSAAEDIPWVGSRLIVGTGAYGSLPIMPDVVEEVSRRAVGRLAVPEGGSLRSDRGRRLA